jgi:small ligand-binding sensory domain FIST
MGHRRVLAAAGLSADPDTGAAATMAAAAAAAGLQGANPDLALVFASGHHILDPDTLLGAVGGSLAPGALIGCGAGGVLGAGRELEQDPAVSVFALALSGPSGHSGRITPFELSATAGDEDGEEVVLSGDLAPAEATILLVDPYRFPAEAALAELAALAPAMPVLGGVASARSGAGSGSLFIGDSVSDAGAVGVRLDGVELLPCVSQGAAPLGREVTVTAAQGNVILELAGRPALETIERLITELPAHEQALLAAGLLLGIVVDSGKPEFEQGDFLVRGVLGADRETGAVAVGAHVHEGQIVCLHARDAGSADDDLRHALRLRCKALGERPLAGALLFSCNGRGRGMFGVGHHDAAAVERELDGTPCAGFFAAGEIGPVAGRSFLHSFTATLALFPG